MRLSIQTLVTEDGRKSWDVREGFAWDLANQHGHLTMYHVLNMTIHKKGFRCTSVQKNGIDKHLEL